MKHWILLLFTATLYSSATQAQETRTPIAGWKSIETEHFEIIFPPGAESQAQRAAASLEAVYEPLHLDFRRGRRLPVVLSGDGAMSNGYATLLPRHSTFYLTPVSDYDELNHTQNWIDTLAIHEYRHIVQFLHAKRGIPRALGWLLGPMAEAVSYSLVLPLWYFEGDAILMETALTDGGRGRRPSFDRDLRALTAERGILSYDHYVSGSIKRPIPNHYRFGYHMVSYGREHYGAKVWQSTAQQAAAWSPLPFVFPLSLKNHTGHYLRGFSAEMMRTRAAQWEQQRSQTLMTEAEDILHPPSNGEALFTRSPQLESDGSIVAFQQGQAVSPRIVRISPTGDTTVLARTGLRMTTRISAAAGVVVWDELELDRFRDSKTTSIIRMMNSTGEVHDLTAEGASFSPALSPDGSAVAVVVQTPSYTPALVLLDTETGRETWRLDYPVHHWLRTPSWSPDGRSLAVVHLTENKGVGLELVDIQTKRRTLLVEPSHTPLTRPSLSKDYVFFSTPVSGLDAVWAQNLKDGSRYRVASRPFAALDPVVDTNEEYVYFADYSYWGTGLQRVPLDPLSWEPAEAVTPVFVDTITPTISQTQGRVAFQSPDAALPVKRYLRVPRLRDATSWSLPLDPSGGSLTLMDPTNLIGVSLSAGFKEDLTPQGSLGIDYRGLPLILSGQVGTQQRWGSLAEVPETQGETSTPTEFSIPDLNTSWTERTLLGGATLPVWLGKGPWTRGLLFNAAASLREVSDIVAQEESVNSIDTNWGRLEAGVRKEVTASVEFYQSLRSAPMAIAPEWSQSLRYTHTLTPFGGDLQGRYQAAEADLGFPGFLPLHSLQLAGSWQSSQGNYTLLPQVLSPRSYTPLASGSVISGRVAYRLPLAYPDLPITPLAFLKRISGGVFYEAAKELSEPESRPIQTVGAELWTDGTLFRLPGDLGLNIGLDVGFRIDTQAPFASIRFLGSSWSSGESPWAQVRTPRLWQR